MYDKVHGEKMNKYVSTPYCRVAMYTGGVACCPLVSHVEYSPSRVNVRKKTSSAVLMLKNMRQTDGRTDGRQADTLRLPLDAAIVKVVGATSNAVGGAVFADVLRSVLRRHQPVPSPANLLAERRRKVPR